MTRTMKITPNQMVQVNDPLGFSYAAEVISLPFPTVSGDATNDSVLVRVPDDPTTLRSVKLDTLSGCDERRYIHYARVKSNYRNARSAPTFPVDMLRYECAAPCNFTLEHDSIGRVVACSKDDDGSLLIAYCSVSPLARWSAARWASFYWRIEPLKSYPRGHDTFTR